MKTKSNSEYVSPKSETTAPLFKPSWKDRLVRWLPSIPVCCLLVMSITLATHTFQINRLVQTVNTMSETIGLQGDDINALADRVVGLENQVDALEFELAWVKAQLTTMKEGWDESKEGAPAYDLTESERKTVCYMVAGEAGYDGYESMWAVATCIYNACTIDNLRPDVVRTAFAYSGWKTNMATESPEHWAEVVEVVHRVFDLGELITDEPILYFYAPKYSAGRWHETQTYVATWGTQKFFARNG